MGFHRWKFTYLFPQLTHLQIRKTVSMFCATGRAHVRYKSLEREYMNFSSNFNTYYSLSLVHRRFWSVLDGSDTCAAKDKKRNHKSSTEVSYLLASPALESFRFGFLFASSQGFEEVLLLYFLVSRSSVLRGHFLGHINT